MACLMSLGSLLNLPSQGGFLRGVAAAAPPSPSPGGGGGAGEGGPPASAPPSPSAVHPPPQQQQEQLRQHHASGGKLRSYVCDHNSAPPAHQYITTDNTNILIRALTLKRNKDELAGRTAAAVTSAGNKRGGGAGGGRAGTAAFAVAAGSRPNGTNGPVDVGASGGSVSGHSGGGAVDDARGKRVASSSEGGQVSGLERAAKRPALDSSAEEHSRLEGLSAGQLREILRGNGLTLGLESAGKAALLARAKLALRGGGR